jgi:hypothetical protein
MNRWCHSSTVAKHAVATMMAKAARGDQTLAARQDSHASTAYSAPCTILSAPDGEAEANVLGMGMEVAMSMSEAHASGGAQRTGLLNRAVAAAAVTR